MMLHKPWMRRPLNPSKYLAEGALEDGTPWFVAGISERRDRQHRHSASSWGRSLKSLKAVLGHCRNRAEWMYAYDAYEHPKGVRHFWVEVAGEIDLDDTMASWKSLAREDFIWGRAPVDRDASERKLTDAFIAEVERRIRVDHDGFETSDPRQCEIMRGIVERRHADLQKGICWSQHYVAGVSPEAPRKGRVYVIAVEGEGVCKIGFSGNPLRRLKSLQTAHYKPLRLVASFPGDLGREASIHRALSAYRLQGEWFALSPDDAVSVVSSHCGAQR